MVGNDIIDIELAIKESRLTRPRVMEKIFSKKEQNYILQSSQPLIMSLILWSMKESAYKLYVQIHLKRFFRPDQFQCFFKKNGASVSYKDFECLIDIKETTNFIFSQATLKDENMSYCCFALSANNYYTQSQETSQKLCVDLATKYCWSRNELMISKSVIGIPSIYYNDKRLSKSISLTHHGNYGAYSIVN